MVSAEEYFNRGIAKQDKGDLRGAIADYDKAITLNPDVAVVWSNRGIARQDKGDLRGAIADYDEAIRLAPDLAEPWNSRSIAKAEQGDLLGAIVDCDEAIKLKPNFAKAWSNRGLAKAQQGDDLPGAIADFDEAIKLKPDLVEVWSNRGIAKMQQGDDLSGAITDFDEAIKLDPDLAKTWNSRGNAKRIQGDLQGAIADYDEAIKLKPDLAAAWSNRGMAKQDQGDLPGVITDYDEAIKLKPDLVEVWSNRGIAKAQQGDLQGAIADYDEAIKLEPELAVAWSNRGIAKVEQGDLLGAIIDCDEAIKLKPDLAEAWICRGIAKAEQGDDLQGAIADYDEVIKLKPDLAAVWYSRAVVRDAVRAGVKPKKIWDMFDNACSAIDELRQALEHKRKDQFNPMHYTNLYTLQNLAEGGKFRLYDAKSMDDSEEGNALFDLFNVDDGLREKMRRTFSDKSSKDLEVFIGSFVTAKNIDWGDDLIWRTYGKHNGEEKAGCALVFDKEQLFSFGPPPLANLLVAGLLVTRSEDLTDKKQDESVPNKEFYLYPVCYKDTKEVMEIQPKVNDLCEALQLCDEEYEETCKMVAVLLNHVRYLFKSAIYQREQEYRQTIVRTKNSPAIQKDPLRTYVECSLDMTEVTVLLGPEVKKAGPWKKWLEGKKTFKEINTTNNPHKA